MVDVIPRSVWGARHEDGGGFAPVPFTEWWLHHSVTIAPDLLPPFDDEYAAMGTLENIGEQRFGRGISYTWPIMPNGRVYQGHSVNRLGAHTGGRNSAARAICLVGNYDVNEATPQQIEAAAQLMVQEYRAGRATRYTLNGGHQQLKATACPGRYGMEAIPAINARAAAILGGAPPIDLEDDDMSVADLERDEAIRHRTVTGELVQTKGIAQSIDQKVDRLLALMAADAEADKRLEEAIDRALQNTGSTVEVDVRELAGEILRQLATPSA